MIFGDLRSLPYRIVAILVAVTVHEFAHAWSADRLGDPTPRVRGRLSLNPIVHLDPIGTLLLLVAGFGWAKPVEVNPRYFSNWRRGMLAVAAAGPIANIVVMLIVGFIVQLGVVSAGTPLVPLIRSLLVINAVLAVFNLLPIHPLDGSKIVSSLLPPQQAIAYDRLAAYGPLVLLVLILLPGNAFGHIVGPAVEWLIGLAVGAR
ncbi:MAG: site-2 protease family protein [Armatimonadota bacterium]|nr:site-2 protease family protein [Armatimonadota bacterium]